MISYNHGVHICPFSGPGRCHSHTLRLSYQVMLAFKASKNLTVASPSLCRPFPGWPDEYVFQNLMTLYFVIQIYKLFAHFTIQSSCCQSFAKFFASIPTLSPHLSAVPGSITSAAWREIKYINYPILVFLFAIHRSGHPSNNVNDRWTSSIQTHHFAHSDSLPGLMVVASRTANL